VIARELHFFAGRTTTGAAAGQGRAQLAPSVARGSLDGPSQAPVTLVDAEWCHAHSGTTTLRDTRRAACEDSSQCENKLHILCTGRVPLPLSSSALGTQRRDPAPLQSLHRYYESVRPSPAHRYFRPRGCSRLRLFPWHRRPGSHVLYRSPVELSRRLHAGCRSVGIRTSSELIPKVGPTLGFDTQANRRRSVESRLDDVIVPAFPRRSRPELSRAK
jgi:hypothetical protein